LDAATREDLQNSRSNWQREQNLTLIVVTHNIEDAVFLGQKILVLTGAPHTTPIIIDNPAAANRVIDCKRPSSKNARNCARRWRQPRMRKRDLIITSLAVLLIWQMIAMLVNRDILPTPIAVAQSFVENFSEIARHFIASGLRVLVSILIAVALAVPARSGDGADSALESHLLAASLHRLSHP